jgi:deazaflavin-dependent oxidoreductase (nitroreductase family)
VADRRWGIQAFWAVHRFLDRVSDGRLKLDRFTAPTLWLATVGRKSGTVRENPLFYLADGQNYVVVASNAGADEDPAWFRNLMASPAVSVRIGQDRHKVVARVATDAEATELWPRLDRVNPNYASYRKGTTRPIQIVILEPRQA